MKLECRESVRRCGSKQRNGDMMNETCTNDGQRDTVIADANEGSGIIPFADEIGQPMQSAEEAPVASRDCAGERFGEVPSRRSIADRELGLDDLRQRRVGKFACPCCGLGTSRVMRVRVVSQPGWSAVCAVCAATLLAKVPGTIVGGMVRPTRRRRSRMPGQVAHGFRRPDQGGYRRAG